MFTVSHKTSLFVSENGHCDVSLETSHCDSSNEGSRDVLYEDTLELQWLKHIWNQENMLEIVIVQANEF